MKRKLTLIIIGVIIILLSVIRLTFAYMKNKIIEDNAQTEVSIKTCAKIQLIDADSSSIKLENTYPMDDKFGLETEGYEFKIQSSCDEYLSFNLYLTSLEGNGITDDNIKYALTDKENNVLITDNLTSEKDGRKDFTAEELKQLEIGIKGKEQNIYKIYSNDIPLKGESTYKLHLWVDSKAGNETMHQTFKAGLSVKTYPREKRLAEQIIESKDKTLIYHDEKCDYEGQENCNLEAGDLSYRYSGSSESVKNYVCLDGTTTTGTCSSDEDLYRIIGLFPNENGEYETKLIKATVGTSNELGDTSILEGSAYASNHYFSWNNARGTETSDNSNMWQYSNLNKKNLNEYYLNTYLAKVKNFNIYIIDHKWATSGLPSTSTDTVQQVYSQELGTEKLTINDKKCYTEENNKTAIICKEEDLNYTAKIGLMYVSDYGYAAYPKAWNNNMGSGGYNQEEIKTNNWMYMGLGEWAISRRSSSGDGARVIDPSGYSGSNYVCYSQSYGVRPAFYLDKSTKLASGDGSKDSPYRLFFDTDSF